jgi:GntR family galactonate operon transcriptional repressor
MANRTYPSLALPGRLAHQIGRQIVSGDRPEGDLLPHETELAEQFDVSRQAVREGLKVLAAKGLVTSRRRAGTHVAPREDWNLLDPDVLAWCSPASLETTFIRDLVELRLLIEPAAAWMAASRADPGAVDTIAAALAEMRRTAAMSEEFYAADVAFHSAIFAASGNSLINQLSTILAPLLQASLRTTHQAVATFPDAISAHADVYEAIVAREADLARSRMRALLSSVADEIAELTSRPRPH